MYVLFSHQPVKVQELFPHWITFISKAVWQYYPTLFSQTKTSFVSARMDWKDMPKAHIVKVRAQETQSEGGSGRRYVGFKFTKLYIY